MLTHVRHTLVRAYREAVGLLLVDHVLVVGERDWGEGHLDRHPVRQEHQLLEWGSAASASSASLARRRPSASLARRRPSASLARRRPSASLARRRPSASLARRRPSLFTPVSLLEARKSAAKNWMSATTREAMDERHPGPNPRGPPPPPLTLPPELRGKTVLWPTQEAKTPFRRAV